MVFLVFSLVFSCCVFVFLGILRHLIYHLCQFLNRNHHSVTKRSRAISCHSLFPAWECKQTWLLLNFVPTIDFTNSHFLRMKSGNSSAFLFTHNVQIWIPPPSIDTPPLYSPSHIYIYIFSKPQLFKKLFWQYHPDETWDKCKNKSMTKSYFFMFSRVQNNVTCFFVSFTFVSNTKLKFNSKQ